jgi:5'-nucleotidase
VSISPHTVRRRASALIALLALFGLVIPAGAVVAKGPPPITTIQILNVSDWHANLDPLNGLGGAWNISARWKVDDDAYPTLKLTAGDDFGAAPPLSGFFDEAPSIQAQRLMGIQVNTFGNHNFDKGVEHLQSMIDLAAAPSTGTHGAHPGQPFRYVATNLSNMDANLTGVDRIAYFTVGGIKVAVIGIVNEDAPSLVSPGGFGTMLPTDGVEATKKAGREARKAGAEAVIVITHKGMASVDPPAGTLMDFANALPGGLVDVVIGDHTNLQYSGTADNGILFHENLSFGASYAKTLLGVRPGKGPGVVSKSVAFVSPAGGTLGADGPSRPDRLCTGNDSNGIPATATFCDQDILDMLDPYRTELAILLDEVIGTTTVPFDRGGNIERRQEVPLGDLIADGMRETYGTDIAFFTGGGIRSQFPACTYKPVDTQLKRINWNSSHDGFLTCAGYQDGGGPYALTKGDVYSVITFGNNILTRNVTGAQLWKTLENGVSLCPATIPASGTCAGRFPQISGFKFTFDKTRPSGCSGNEDAGTGPITWACTADASQYRVTSVTWADGVTPIPNDPTYVLSMAVVDFTNNGGDSYWMLADGQGVTRDRDANVMLSYMDVIGPDLDPPTQFPGGRITICPCP